MSSDIVIRVENVSKCYQVYDRPQDRLKQSVVPKIKRLLGKSSDNYYRDFWALHDISFEVKRGESLGILGRNGSGKSTLLQVITGNLTPTSGSVEFNGRIAALLELGSGFNLEFTGRENVYLNGALLGLSRAQVDDKFDAIAAFADIGQFIDQPVKTYSSGMLVRLAFAVQVQVEPDILIVDEALAVGDALFQKRCFQQIEKMRSNGVTLLFVSHDIESIRTLTNKSLLLNNGRVLRLGLSSEVVLDYRKLLHEQESEYFSELTRKIAEKASAQEAGEGSSLISRERNDLSSSEVESTASERSGNLSFGEGGVEIVSVQTINESGESTNIFYPGDFIKICVVCESKIKTDKLNVGIRIRNKEGVKIYSWGTLNQDMKILDNNKDESVFWKKCVEPGETFKVMFEAPCRLGQNLYEVQVSVSHEKTPNYLNQRILRWIDEAAFFQVMMRREDHFFGGIIDLEMAAKWEAVK